MTFPMKNSVSDNFLPAPLPIPPLKSANFIFIVVSLSLIENPPTAYRAPKRDIRKTAIFEIKNWTFEGPASVGNEN